MTGIVAVTAANLHRGYGTLDRPPCLPFQGVPLDCSPEVLRAEDRAAAEIIDHLKNRSA